MRNIRIFNVLRETLETSLYLFRIHETKYVYFLIKYKQDDWGYLSDCSSDYVVNSRFKIVLVVRHERRTVIVHVEQRYFHADKCIPEEIVRT